jgi:hypothetical protein
MNSHYTARALSASIPPTESAMRVCASTNSDIAELEPSAHCIPGSCSSPVAFSISSIDRQEGARDSTRERRAVRSRKQYTLAQLATNSSTRLHWQYTPREKPNYHRVRYYPPTLFWLLVERSIPETSLRGEKRTREASLLSVMACSASGAYSVREDNSSPEGGAVILCPPKMTLFSLRGEVGSLCFSRKHCFSALHGDLVFSRGDILSTCDTPLRLFGEVTVCARLIMVYETEESRKSEDRLEGGSEVTSERANQR